jgi:hypothetical protein
VTTTGSSALAGIVGPINEPKTQRVPQSELDKWAATLASTLAQQLPPPPALGAPNPTEPWRQSVGALTPGSSETLTGQNAAHTQAATGSASSADGAPNPERVHLSTHVPDLGEVSVMVDRSAAGVRVVIGVEDAQAATLIDPERLRLQGALVAAGVGVDSIRIVQLDRRGTLLASSKGNVSRTPDHHSDSQDQERSKRSRGRKLNFVG